MAGGAGVAFVCMAFAACEDEAPTAYTAMRFVEAYLIVDEPIRDVVVGISRPLSEPYDHAQAMVPDAEVIIESGGERFVLAWRIRDGIGSYFLPDSTVLVEPGRKYNLTVRYSDGKTVTAETTTPERIAWTRIPPPLLQYPSDTVNLPSPDSLRISWTPGNTVEYLVRVRCLDTADYGRYLNPPTSEANGRTNNLSSFETPDSRTFYGTTRWGFVQTTAVPTVWTAFRWYGRNEVAILAPDAHFLDWFKLTRFSGSPQHNREYSNIRGGSGVFGSATQLSSEVFLLKRSR